MKPHPRIRKTIKWGGAAVTVLLVVAWIGTRWFELTWSPDGKGWLIGEKGRLLIVRRGLGIPGFSSAAYWRHIEPPQIEWGSVWQANAYDSFLALPLWAPAATLLAITAIAWRLDTLARRRDRLNLCPKCNYDRAGLGAGAKCPECGIGGTPA